MNSRPKHWSQPPLVVGIAQEALTNVVRPARASEVSVLLERRNNVVISLIEDDGVGFACDVAMQSGRLGLAGVRVHARVLGGSVVCRVFSGPSYHDVCGGAPYPFAS